MNTGTKLILCCIIMAVVLQGYVNCDLDEPFKLVEEVVSIYNDNFATPESREPYFIKVHRCIAGEDFNPPDSCWAAADTREIEIVVPDINDSNKFYKYVVYNHTSCKYDNRDCKSGPEKQHGNVSYEVNEAEFKAKFPKNPVNLRSCDASSFCSEPQPRYKVKFESLAEDDYITRDKNYQLYHQCLPGCSNTTKTESIKVTLRNGRTKIIEFENDTACAPYSSKAMRQSNKPERGSVSEPESVSESGLFISIGSPKVFLAAFVLSLILLSILIVDFNLCHRKKGFFYTLLRCKKDTTDKNCPDCLRRKQEIIEVV